jgi:hypothetical protein
VLALKEKVAQLQAENNGFKNKLEQEERRVDSTQSQTHLLNHTLDQLKVILTTPLLHIPQHLTLTTKEELASAMENEEVYNNRIDELEHSLRIVFPTFPLSLLYFSF